jgi:hypothetical protein
MNETGRLLAVAVARRDSSGGGAGCGVLGRALLGESAGASDDMCQLIGCVTDDLGFVVSARNVVEGLLDTRQVADDESVWRVSFGCKGLR